MAARLPKAGMRILFILVVVVWIVTSPSSAISLTEKSSTENPVISKAAMIFPLGPVVSGTDQNSTIIRIVADSDCIPVIRYVNDSSFSISQDYDKEISGLPSGRNHAISITNLEPSTKYHYQISGCGIQNTDRIFTTFPAGGSCTFIVYGDTREQAPLYNQTDRHKLVADRIAQEQDVLFVVNSGDLVSDSSDLMEWSRFFDATDKLRSITTYNAVPGNHDTDRLLFRQLFGMDTTAFFDCGNTRVVLLDSTDLSAIILKEQAEWLKSAFRFYKGEKIVILHYPVYSSDVKHYGGWQNLQETLVPAFQKSGVRLVFNSHVHAFEQVEHDSITYITEARGGAPGYPLNTTRIPGSVRAYENTLGYSRVSIDPEAGEIKIDVIRVADVSGDLRNIIKIYPDDTVDAHIRIQTAKPFNRFPDVYELVCFVNNVKDKSGC